MNYMKIDPCDIANGPGVRVTLFCSGCSHHCQGCHNPQTWDPNAGQPFTDETLNELIDLLRPDYIQGLTLTGGDPLYPENRIEIFRILFRVAEEFEGKKDVWMWTGYTWEELMQDRNEPLDRTDLCLTDILAFTNVLVDGPFIEAQKDISLPYMGSSNQRVIDPWESFGKDEPVLWWVQKKKGK